MTLSPKDIAAWAQALLGAAGLERGDSGDVADIFLRASLRGVGHHDISFLPQRLDWIFGHGVKPRPGRRLIHSGPAFEIWDGDCGLGELNCRRITERAISLSRATGLAYAAVRRSNHFLAAAPYTQLGVEAGCLLIVFSNTDPCMTRPQGTVNFIGNNPLGFGLGAASHPPLGLDVCMAYSSLGNLKALAAQGSQVPDYWGLDERGQASRDPEAILRGAVRPIGGHKGFGLALLTECLTGILAGGQSMGQIPPGGGVNGHSQAVIAFDLESFGGREAIEGRVESMIGQAKAADPQVRFPGERSAAERERESDLGIRIGPELLARLASWSERLGVDVPQ